MPWKAFHTDGEWCVFKLDEEDERTGGTLGCHESESAANEQVAALFASEEGLRLMEEADESLATKGVSEDERRQIKEIRASLKQTRDALAADKIAEQEEDSVPDKTKTGETERPKGRKLKEYATSFAALRAQVSLDTAMDEVDKLTYQFRDIAWTILYTPEIENKVSALQGLADEYIDLVAESLGTISEKDAEPIVESEEVGLAESDVGTILSIAESQSVEMDEPEPLTLEVVVIEPGWGNTKDNHYYSTEMLAEYARVFEGAKMYATDHRATEKNVLTEVSQVLECPVRFTETGAPVARVGVFDNTFAESIRNRAALGKLEDLHVSILANGTARPFEEDGRKGKAVEKIADGASVDWVTRAGAGGHALQLAENQQEEDGMPDEILTDEVEEVEGEVEVVEVIVEESDDEPIEEGTVEPKDVDPVNLSEAEVAEALSASNLPDVSRERLTQVEYETQEQLSKVIAIEKAYIEKLTGAGRPVGQNTQNAQRAPVAMTEEEYQKLLDEADTRHGMSLKA